MLLLLLGFMRRHESRPMCRVRGCAWTWTGPRGGHGKPLPTHDTRRALPPTFWRSMQVSRTRCGISQTPPLTFVRAIGFLLHLLPLLYPLFLLRCLPVPPCRNRCDGPNLLLDPQRCWQRDQRCSDGANISDSRARFVSTAESHPSSLREQTIMCSELATGAW